MFYYSSAHLLVYCNVFIIPTGKASLIVSPYFTIYAVSNMYILCMFMYFVFLYLSHFVFDDGIMLWKFAEPQWKTLFKFINETSCLRPETFLQGQSSDDTGILHQQQGKQL